MEKNTILICSVFLVIACYILLSEDKIYKSHKISPVSGERTKITCCIHDPFLNNGFIVSLSSSEELKEIQKSLKVADKKYIISEENGDYYLINNKHKREQYIRECSFKLMKNLMKKNNTRMIDYSV